MGIHIMLSRIDLALTLCSQKDIYHLPNEKKRVKRSAYYFVPGSVTNSSYQIGRKILYHLMLNLYFQNQPTLQPESDLLYYYN